MSVQKEIEKFLIEKTSFEDVATNDRLLDRGVIDSFMLMELIVFVETEFGVKLKDDDLTPANFNKLEAISALVNMRQSESQ